MPKPNRTPSITRIFAATYVAVALVALFTQVATWRSARATQAAVVDLAQRLDRMNEPAGEIGLESDVGKGSTLWVTLPQAR